MQSLPMMMMLRTGGFQRKPRHLCRAPRLTAQRPQKAGKPGALQYTALYLMLLGSCRPADLCERLGNCHEYGMPSSHTQLMAFAFVLYMLLVTRAPASTLAAGRAQRGFQLAQGAVLGLLTAAVAYSRIYLGYHSPSQVPIVSYSSLPAMQLMRLVLMLYKLLFTSCLSTAASIELATNRWQHAPHYAAGLGMLSVAMVCSHCCIYLRHPSLIEVPLGSASPCYQLRTLACTEHAADCVMMQDSVGPLPAETALGESKSVRSFSTFS